MISTCSFIFYYFNNRQHQKSWCVSPNSANEVTNMQKHTFVIQYSDTFHSSSRDLT